MTPALCDQTATNLAAMLRAGDCTSLEIVESCLARTEAVDDRVRAFLARTADLAREHAAAAHARIAAGDAPAVAGIPLALKDVLSTRGVTTTCGSKNPRDLRAAVRLHAVGAAAGGRCRPARQDELPRVRDGLVEREL